MNPLTPSSPGASGRTDGPDTYCTSGTSPTPALRATIPLGPRGSGQLSDGTIAYEVVGSPLHPLVVVLGGISAGRHVCASDAHPEPGWWEEVITHEGGVNRNRFRILGIDWLGGPGGSVVADPGVLRVTTDDQAAALAAVLDHVGVQTAEAIVGASYGGMVALAFAARFPGRVSQVVAISAAHRTHPMATALRSLQRRIVRLGTRVGAREEALSVARGIAMTTYRTAAEFAERFDAAPIATDGGRFPVEAYLEHCGRTFANRFDADAFLRLSHSIDLHDVDPAEIHVPVTLVPIDSDTLVPEWQVRVLAASLAGRCRVEPIASRFGHDAFLKDAAVVAAVVREAIEEPVDRSASPVTAAVRAAIGADRQHGAVMPPVHLSSTFAFEGFGRPGAYDYTRSGNPTRDHLAAAIAQLEGGAGAVVTASGMAAVTVVAQLLDAGDVLLAPVDCYGGTRRLFDSLAQQGRIRVEYVACYDPSVLRDACRRLRPRMLWVETPSNPLLRVTDLALAGELARAAGAWLVVDNTFLSPVLQTPIAFGADIVVHSTTKFINGHSDVVGGVAVGRTREVCERLAWWANCLGVTGAPFDSYLTLRGLRSLHARTAIHRVNAEAIVEVLLRHAAVRTLHYPGAPTHPDREIALRQQRGFGSLVSFELAGGDAGIRAFLHGLRHFSLAESLGGVESLVAHPATMTHAAMSQEARRAAGIADSLLRLSVGIEDATDLVADVTRALGRAWRVACRAE